jgi:cell division protein FtsI (penicillin-binding protein 3)
VKGSGTIGNAEYVSFVSSEKSVQVKGANPDAQLAKGIMPDLRGMNAADAVYLLENKGIKVRIRGAGTVIRQSVAPGEKVPANKEVVLELSI